MRPLENKKEQLTKDTSVTVSLKKNKHDSFFVEIETTGTNLFSEKFNFGYRPDVSTPAEEQVEDNARQFYADCNRVFLFEWYLDFLHNSLKGVKISKSNFKRDTYVG